MPRSSPSELAAQYRAALLEDVIPFWERHSPDREHGGYFTCLARDGAVFDTDKFVWLQARQVWMFSTLYTHVETRPEWLEMARLGADFLRAHGRAENGDWYFSLTREGRPLVQPYNIFSDCFAAMAFARYAEAAGDEEAAELALTTYSNILRRRDDPKGKYSKLVPGTRPTRNVALPMLLCNLTIELADLLPAAEVDRAMDECMRTVMNDFVRPDDLIMRENIPAAGGDVDSFEGRLVNPGHTVEAMWFVMDLAHRRGDHGMVERAVDVALNALAFGWDEEFGGLYYFRDRLGRPPQQLEWDQKLWWVHLEALVAMALAYAHTGREECRAWYDRVHAYAWPRFSDPAFGEWYGYLNRRGEVLLPLKGGKWKGCFHVPRALLLCWRIFDEVANR